MLELGRCRNSLASPCYGATQSIYTIAKSGRRLLCWIYLASAIGGICQTTAFQCPPDHYQYPSGVCSSCFTVINDNERFTDALQRCSLLGGQLTTTEDEINLRLLSRYLEGLKETRKLWIGYRLSSSGSRIGLEGNNAPSVLLDDNNFVGSTSGDDNSCVGIQNGRFFVAPCDNMLSFICTIVFNAPSAVREPNVDTVYAAQSQRNIELQASVTGNGIKFVEWKFNGTGISQRENGIELSTSGQTSTGLVATLTISAYDSTTHLGTYELLVTSQAGTASVATWLVRDAVIDLTVSPSNLSIPGGQLAAFECNAANSRPRPRFAWYNGTEEIVNGSDPRVFISELSGTLFIRDVQASDAGLYHCVVENVAGRVTSERATLSLIAADEFSRQFVLQPRDLTVLRGDSFSVECYYAQNIQPRIIVTLVDQRRRPLLEYTYPDSTEPFPVYRVEEAVPEEHECFYCTTVSDPYDPQLITGSEKSSIDVQAVAQVERLSTIRNGMRSESISQSIPLGGSASLECEVSGIPTPSTVEWTRDGVSIADEVMQNLNVSTLTVPAVSDSSIYQCHVENVHGGDSHTVFLCAVEQEDEVPGPVTFTAEPDTNTSLYIRWSQDTPSRTHPLLLQYEILLNDTTSDVSLTFGPFPSSQTSYTVTDLEPNTEYLVSVVATSLLERSNATMQAVSTFPSSPTGMVNNITVERNDENTILIVQWDPYRTPDGEEVSQATYDVEYRVGGDDSSAIQVFNGTLGIIRDLINAQTYEVRVRVTVQIVRDPPQFASSEWSKYIQVQGITTLPTSLTPPRTEAVAPDESAGLLTTEILLAIIFGILGGLLIVVVVIVAIVIVYRMKTSGGKYSVQDRRRTRAGPQYPMRDEVFNMSTSLPTSPTPPPLSISNQLGATQLSSSIIGSNERAKSMRNGTVNTSEGALIRNQENGRLHMQNGSSQGFIPNVSSQSLQRSGSTSPLPLPPPVAEVEDSYLRTNLYAEEPFTNRDPQIIVTPPPSTSSAGYTDQVHDIPTDHFHKLDMSHQMFEGGTPEVFDRLEGFDRQPVRTMATFDIITTGGANAGSCDTLTRYGTDSRNDMDSLATVSSSMNQTPEPLTDHRVTFAPTIITISPKAHVDQELSKAILELNSSTCNNNESYMATGCTDILDFNLPPVASIVGGEELNITLEPSSTITI